MTQALLNEKDAAHSQLHLNVKELNPRKEDRNLPLNALNHQNDELNPGLPNEDQSLHDTDLYLPDANQNHLHVDQNHRNAGQNHQNADQNHHEGHLGNGLILRDEEVPDHHAELNHLEGTDHRRSRLKDLVGRLRKVAHPRGRKHHESPNHLAANEEAESRVKSENPEARNGRVNHLQIHQRSNKLNLFNRIFQIDKPPTVVI